MAIKVITPPEDEPLTLAEVKLNLRIPFDDEDEDIERMIRAARQMAEGRLNRALMPQTLEFAQNGFPCTAALNPYGAIRVPRPPFVDLVSIAYVDGDGATQTLDPAAYTVNAYVEPAEIAPAFDSPWPAVRLQPASVVVRYEAGYADAASVPEPIQQWMLLAIGAMYENRNSVSEVQTYSLPEDFMCMLLQPYTVYE